MFGGIGADISALVTEQCFEFLDAPVQRVASLETPVPFNPILEEQFMPQKRFGQVLKDVLAY